MTEWALQHPWMTFWLVTIAIIAVAHSIQAFSDRK